MGLASGGEWSVSRAATVLCRSMPPLASAETPSSSRSVKAQIEHLPALAIEELRVLWQATFKKNVPKGLSRDLMVRTLAWRIQEKAFGGHDRDTLKVLASYARAKPGEAPMGRRLKSGTILVREFRGTRHTVTVVRDGFIWGEGTYSSLSQIAKLITGKNWNGPRFFGLRVKGGQGDMEAGAAS